MNSMEEKNNEEASTSLTTTTLQRSSVTSKKVIELCWQIKIWRFFLHHSKQRLLWLIECALLRKSWLTESQFPSAFTPLLSSAQHKNLC